MTLLFHASVLLLIINIVIIYRQSSCGFDNVMTKFIANSLLAQIPCHNTVHLGGLFALKQLISCSLKSDTVPRVNNLYCFYVKNPQNRLHYGIVQVVNNRADA